MRKKTKKGPKAKRPKKLRTVAVKVTDEQKIQIEELSKRLGCSQSAVLARALPVFIKSLEALENTGCPELTMTGDDVTVSWKMKVIESIANGCGITRAAHAAGVTLQTVRWQIRRDRVFSELCAEAKGRYVEEFEEVLDGLARGDYSRTGTPNVTAVLAKLNAHHPDYGVMRKASADRLMEEFFELVVEEAELYLPSDDLQRYCEGLALRCEQLSEKVRPGKG